MEIVDACSDLLSNREVLELLRSNISNKQTNLATILYETTSYLESSPISLSSPSSINMFLGSLKESGYNLNKMEQVQILNSMPQNETELSLIIDNIEERFSEEQRSHLLNLIQSTLIQTNAASETNESIRKKLKQ